MPAAATAAGTGPLLIHVRVHITAEVGCRGGAAVGWSDSLHHVSVLLNHISRLRAELALLGESSQIVYRDVTLLG